MRNTKTMGIAAVVVAGFAAIGAAPAQADTMWVPCDTPAIGPLCDTADRQVDHVLAEAEAATDYVLYWGDEAIELVNETYATVRCDVLGECG